MNATLRRHIQEQQKQMADNFGQWAQPMIWASTSGTFTPGAWTTWKVYKPATEEEKAEASAILWALQHKLASLTAGQALTQQEIDELVACVDTAIENFCPGCLE
jgi:hypothetical protein